MILHLEILAEDSVMAESRTLFETNSAFQRWWHVQMHFALPPHRLNPTARANTHPSSSNQIFNSLVWRKKSADRLMVDFLHG
jgi:hypothetical protein